MVLYKATATRTFSCKSKKHGRSQEGSVTEKDNAHLPSRKQFWFLPKTSSHKEEKYLNEQVIEAIIGGQCQ